MSEIATCICGHTYEIHCDALRKPGCTWCACDGWKIWEPPVSIDLRDKFAGQIASEYVAWYLRQRNDGLISIYDIRTIANSAYEIADGLIERRNRK